VECGIAILKAHNTSTYLAVWY